MILNKDQKILNKLSQQAIIHYENYRDHLKCLKGN